MSRHHNNHHNDDHDDTPVVKESLWAKITRQGKALLTQNLTPYMLALSLSMGFTLGLFPVPGFTFVLCGILAWMFNLNQPAIQFVNFIVTPVEIACIPLFLWFGEVLLQRDTHFSLSPAALTAALKADVRGAFTEFGGAIVAAVLGWVVFVPPATLVLTMMLTPILRRVMPTTTAPTTAKAGEHIS